MTVTLDEVKQVLNGAGLSQVPNPTKGYIYNRLREISEKRRRVVHPLRSTLSSNLYKRMPPHYLYRG